MGFFARIVSSRIDRNITGSELRGNQRQNLIHIFVFDSSGEGLEKSRRVNSLVRSVIPESLAYADVPISFFIDHLMPIGIGSINSSGRDTVRGYSFAWQKIGEANPEYVKAMEPEISGYSYACEEYGRGKGHRGVVIGIYERARDKTDKKSHTHHHEG
jgi:hypothetical protein